MLTVTGLWFDHERTPVGLDHTPVFGWQLEGNCRNIRQTQYRLQVALTPDFAALLYDETCETGNSTAVHAAGLTLQSLQKYYARVQVWADTAAGPQQTLWSEPAVFITALLDPAAEWKAEFVSAESPETCRKSSAGTMVRAAFAVKPGLRAAYACTTALGLYNVYLNGQKVSTDEMTPGWTSYNRRLLYQTYEVTAMLHPGLNMAGAMLGAGWYKGVMGLTRSRNNYGDTTAFAMQLTLVYLLVIALKYGALPGALDSIAAAVGPNTTVMSLMNGVDSEEIIAAKIGAEHVLPSLIKVASHKEADGYHFNPETTIGIIYGELAAPLKSERVQAVEALLAGTGIHSRVTPYIKEEIWSKFRLNVCNNLPQAILGAGVGCYQSSAHMKAISDGLCHELEAIAVAKGIDLSKVDASSRHGSLVPPATRYSTLQDLDAGRHTEIDMFSGALMRMGQELGIPTPYNEYTYHMIKALEEKNDGLFDYAAKASDLTCAK